MRGKYCRRILPGVIATSAAVIVLLFAYFSIFFSFLSDFTVGAGDPVNINMFHNRILSGFTLDVSHDSSESATYPDKLRLNFKALGIIPFKKMAIKVVSPISVVPGGQSIGIMMHSKGVMVVGMSDISDERGNRVNPSEEAGIRVGDVITAINGRKINDEYQLKNEINLIGSRNDINLEIKRENKFINLKLRAVTCRETKRPRIGLFVRDSASGVGTLSFYHPNSALYGALGHIITDVDTARGIDLSDGRIVEASVRAIHRGKKGQPGEKVGMILEDGSISGNIEKNTKFGIYGKIKAIPENPYFQKPVPVAMNYEIKKGPALLYTVIEGTEINRYSVEIQDVFYPWNSRGKGMVIKVTDSNLINTTGGIIQGMSGSPIIQEGKLVGVVTHVFINDPLRGYGIPAEWMLKEIGLLNDKTQQKAS